MTCWVYAAARPPTAARGSTNTRRALRANAGEGYGRRCGSWNEARAIAALSTRLLEARYVAARILASYLKRYSDPMRSALLAGDYARGLRLVTGGTSDLAMFEGMAKCVASKL